MLKNFWRPKAAVTEPAADEPPADTLQVVFSSYSPVEAHIVSGMLEDNGIECALNNELFAYVDNPISNATGGVKVLVRTSDIAQAKELLRQSETSANSPEAP